MFYQPDRVLHFPPEKVGFQPQEIFFESGDGTRLSSWYFKSKKKSKGTIIQFHGNGENMSSHYLLLIWLVQEGYDLFVFDYRGYGLSKGKAEPDGVYQDSLAALDKAWELHKSNSEKGKFIVVGQSLGGAIAMKALENWPTQNEVDLLVLDSTFSSYRRVARRVLMRNWITFLFSPLAWILVSDRYASEEAMKKYAGKILLIHDRADPIVPFSCAENSKAMIKNLVDFWQPEWRSHNGAFYSNQSPYRAQLLQLLAN